LIIPPFGKQWHGRAARAPLPADSSAGFLDSGEAQGGALSSSIFEASRLRGDRGVLLLFCINAAATWDQRRGAKAAKTEKSPHSDVYLNY
jgi:hypothetical protein